MDFTLRFPNDEHVISGISNFTYAWGINCGLAPKAACELALATTEVVTDIIRFAFGSKEESFDVRYKSSAKHGEVILHELGEPFRPERYIYDIAKVREKQDFEGAGFKVIRHFTDDFIYLNKGKEGKEFRLMKSVSDKHIAQLMSPQAMRAEGQQITEAERDYHFELVTPEGADEISKLIYRVYRHSYYKDVLYYPRKLASAIAQGKKFGVIVRSGTGEPCGFFAVIRNKDSNIGEVGEAVVLRKHRRQGLMKRMLEALILESRRRKLLGLYGEANASHIFSQRANARFHFKTSALLLALMPPMQMTGFSADAVSQPVSTVFEFLPLQPLANTPRFLPKQYAHILREIYHQFLDDDEILFDAFQGGVQEQESVMDVDISYEDQFAVIIVNAFGPDLIQNIETTLEDLYAQGMMTVHIDLPLDDPGVLTVCDPLRELGLVFAGLMPSFHHERDYLRMQKTVIALDFDKVYVYSDVAKHIKELILKELNAS